MAILDLKDAANSVTAHYLAQFSGQDPRPAWLHEYRQDAFARFTELDFPHHKHEGWRQTNVAPIAQGRFVPQTPPPPAVLVPRLRALDLPGVDWSPEAARLVFVNGRYAPGLSSESVALPGVRLGSLARLFDTERELVQRHLGHSEERDQAFVQLNQAFLTDGALVEIANGAVIDKPISILYVTANGEGGGPAIVHPYTLILAGREAQVSVVETVAGFDGEVYFSNAVTDIEIGENAHVEYARIEQESRNAFHVAKLRSRQLRDSRFTSHHVALGGRLVRHNIHSILDGEGSECRLDGLYALAGDQHVDNSTVLDHVKPLGTSRESYKGVLDGKSAGIFNGRIIVRPDAQHTDAIQSNKNLLLSDGAITSSQPQLEIYADDVRCTHGATVGELDSQALFYLRSRGLGLEESRKLLIYAFAADVLSSIQAPGLRERLEALLWQKWTV